jgi:hypothetical protein
MDTDMAQVKEWLGCLGFLLFLIVLALGLGVFFRVLDWAFA